MKHMKQLMNGLAMTFSVLIVACIAQTATAQATDDAPAKPAEEASLPKIEYVQMTTSKGDIILELNREKAPISVENFLSYVDKEFYNGTIFHRVIPTFMIQGGGFTNDMQQKPTEKPIKNEWRNGLKNERGTVAMARTAVADSATSQFFINVTDNAFLDQPRDGAAYAVFGKVVAGMNVVDAIRVVPTHTHPAGHQNVPLEPVVIERMKRISEEEAKKKIEAEKKPAATSPSQE
jgi:peptidyl-prolyl cis-trans isomerase A (cyclophilin A)